MKKKVLLLSYSGKPSGNCGGGNRIIFELMNRLRNNGISLHYLDSNGKTISDIKESYNENLNIKISDNYNIKDKIKHTYLIQRIKLFIKRKKINYAISQLGPISVINAHDSIILSLINKSNVPKILSIHHKYNIAYDQTNNASGFIYTKKYLAYLLKLERKSISNADIIVFVSEASYLNYLSQYGEILSAKKTMVIPNGIDLDHISKINEFNFLSTFQTNFQMYDLHIVNIANHISSKNIDIVIKTIDVLKRDYLKNPLLINIGFGPLTNSYKKLVTQLSLDNNVMFLGKLENNMTLSILKWAKYFIMTSENVVFDIVVIEALATECVVILSNNGGNRDIIIDQFNGYLVDENDPNIFAKKIMEADPKVIKNNSSDINKYDILNMIVSYSNLFNTLI